MILELKSGLAYTKNEGELDLTWELVERIDVKQQCHFRSNKLNIASKDLKSD